MAYRFIRIMEKAGQAQNELFAEFNRIASECYANGDVEGFYYWLGRAHDMTEEKIKLTNDLNKLCNIEEPKKV